MKFLLDTHIWIWLILEPSRISQQVAKTLASLDELWVSPVSAWEASILLRRGRIRSEQEPELWLREAFSRSSFRSTGLSIEVATATYGIRLPHHDPFDRLLAATAKVLDLTLVTSDRKLIACPDIRTLAN